VGLLDLILLLSHGVVLSKEFEVDYRTWNSDVLGWGVESWYTSFD